MFVVIQGNAKKAKLNEIKMFSGKNMEANSKMTYISKIIDDIWWVIMVQYLERNNEELYLVLYFPIALLSSL